MEEKNQLANWEISKWKKNKEFENGGIGRLKR